MRALCALSSANALVISSQAKTALMTLFHAAQHAYYPLRDESGFESHVSSTGLMSTVYRDDSATIVAFKGASPLFWGIPLGKYARNDFTLVEALFACCDSQREQCVQRRLNALADHPYLNEALALVRSIRRNSPDGRVFLTGHSLGGAIASYVAHIEQLPAVTFSAPGELYFMKMLGQLPPSPQIVHIGACDDPIYRGKCNSRWSLCHIAGYRLETQCHTGVSYCVRAKGVSGILNHRLDNLARALAESEALEEVEAGKCTDCEYASTAGLAEFIPGQVLLIPG